MRIFSLLLLPTSIELQAGYLRWTSPSQTDTFDDRTRRHTSTSASSLGGRNPIIRRRASSDRTSSESGSTWPPSRIFCRMSCSCTAALRCNSTARAKFDSRIDMLSASLECMAVGLVGLLQFSKQCRICLMFDVLACWRCQVRDRGD